MKNDEEMNAAVFRETTERILDEVHKVVVGQTEVMRLILISILADGHVILTGVPGLGRTLIGEAMGKALGLEVNRIQFTPDLLPTDVTGNMVVERRDGACFYRYVPGPIFAHMILADEINRAPSRTQAALLEAMQERQVTVAGKRHPLKKPFIVIATQNNLDTEGVYPLPEAQIDRFLMQIEMDYPSEEEECAIIDATTSTRSAQINPVCDPETVTRMQNFAKVVPVPQTMKAFTVQLVRRSRAEKTSSDETEAEERSGRWFSFRWLLEMGRSQRKKESIARYIRWGASPRAGQAILRCAKVAALMEGRNYVTKADIMRVAYPVLAHRLIPDHRAGAKGLSSKEVVSMLIEEVLERLTPQPTSSRMEKLLKTTPTTEKGGVT